MIFIDTGPWIARYLARDQHHESAKRGWAMLGRRRRPTFTSNFVLDEAITFISRRAGYRFATDRAKAIYNSSVLTILRPTADEEIAALALLEKLGDQKVSFTDCVSFALMKRHDLRRAFTFDRQFESAGFEAWAP